MKTTILIPIAAAVFAIAARGQTQAQQAPQASQKETAKTPRPRMSGSMTGYIENAVVGSQVRMQFDGIFHVDSPDRDEFFYAKCGCYRGLAGNPVFDPHSPGPGQGIVTNLKAQEFHLDLEYAPVRRFSFFAEIPERSLQVQTAVQPGGAAFSAGKFSSSGIGDFRSGFKAAIIESEDLALTFQFRTYSPTGDALLGLGTNHVSIEPSLLFNQRTSQRTTLAGQFSFWHPIDGAAGFTTAPAGLATSSSSSFAGNILNYGLGGSYDLGSLGYVRFTPVLEFVAWRVLDGYRTGDAGPVAAGGENIVNGKVGVRMTFGHNSVYVGYGRALTHDIWYQEIARIEYRYVF